MLSEQLSLPTNKTRYHMIMSVLYNISVGSLSFLFSMLVASIISLIILFCFFNAILFVITFLIIAIMFLVVLAGATFILFGGAFMFYTNNLNK